MLIVMGGWDAFYQATASTEVATTTDILISSILTSLLANTALILFTTLPIQVFNYSQGGEWRLVAFHTISDISKKP